MDNETHVNLTELEAGLAEIELSPKSEGKLEMIVRRPEVDQREVIEVGVLNLEEGLVGDNWKDRPSRHTDDGKAWIEMQINIMNSRCIALVAKDRSRWQLAGDQLFIDFDLSEDHLPVGSRLAIGNAIVEVTAPPHMPCKKFVARYGMDAMRFLSSPHAKQLHLRGVNAKVIQPGVIRTGDRVAKV